MLGAESEAAEEGQDREGADRGELGAGQAPAEAAMEGEGLEPGGEQGAGQALVSAVTEGEGLEPGGGPDVGQVPVEVQAEDDGPEPGGERDAGQALVAAVIEGERIDPGGEQDVGQVPDEASAEGEGPEPGRKPDAGQVPAEAVAAGEGLRAVSTSSFSEWVRPPAGEGGRSWSKHRGTRRSPPEVGGRVAREASRCKVWRTSALAAAALRTAVRSRTGWKYGWMALSSTA